jgi:hypothetical protein
MVITEFKGPQSLRGEALAEADILDGVLTGAKASLTEHFLKMRILVDQTSTTMS